MVEPLEKLCDIPKTAIFKPFAKVSGVFLPPNKIRPELATAMGLVEQLLPRTVQLLLSQEILNHDAVLPVLLHFAIFKMLRHMIAALIPGVQDLIAGLEATSESCLAPKSFLGFRAMITIIAAIVVTIVMRREFALRVEVAIADRALPGVLWLVKCCLMSLPV